MNKLMISTVALAVGLGVATSAMAVAPAVGTYNFEYYTTLMGMQYEYDVQLEQEWVPNSTFQLNNNHTVGHTATILPGKKALINFTFKFPAPVPVIAQCQATVQYSSDGSSTFGVTTISGNNAACGGVKFKQTKLGVFQINFPSGLKT